jgi:hypothetical protein
MTESVYFGYRVFPKNKTTVDLCDVLYTSLEGDPGFHPLKCDYKKYNFIMYHIISPNCVNNGIIRGGYITRKESIDFETLLQLEYPDALFLLDRGKIGIIIKNDGSVINCAKNKYTAKIYYSLAITASAVIAIVLLRRCVNS